MTYNNSAVWQSLTLEHVQPNAPPQHDVVATLCAIEQHAHSHAWTRGNFIDSIRAGYRVRLLWAVPMHALRGYYVAMPGVCEAHLLDLTVAPAYQGQGWARVLLDDVTQWAACMDARELWLEVRQSNARARHVYSAYGYQCVGQRKRYYPSTEPGGPREDAQVMCLSVPHSVHSRQL